MSVFWVTWEHRWKKEIKTHRIIFFKSFFCIFLEGVGGWVRVMVSSSPSPTHTHTHPETHSPSCLFRFSNIIILSRFSETNQTTTVLSAGFDKRFSIFNRFAFEDFSTLIRRSLTSLLDAPLFFRQTVILENIIDQTSIKRALRGQKNWCVPSLSASHYYRMFYKLKILTKWRK